MTQNEKYLLLKDLCARLHTCNCINGTALTVALADEQPLEANQRNKRKIFSIMVSFILTIIIVFVGFQRMKTTMILSQWKIV